MSSPQAAQQIANLLVQAGVPSGHALDVAQRLLTMANSGPVAAQGEKTIDSTAANNSEFFNKYKTDEQNAKDGRDGKAGKDGLPGYGGRGVDGRDGIPGVPGRDGEVNWDNIRDMIAQMIREALAVFLAHLLNTVLSCTWFTRKYRDCITTQPGGGGVGGGCPKCCKDWGNGIQPGKDVCEVLSQHASMLQKIRRRLDAIEKDLKNTTDCEA